MHSGEWGRDAAATCPTPACCRTSTPCTFATPYAILCSSTSSNESRPAGLFWGANLGGRHGAQAVRPTIIRPQREPCGSSPTAPWSPPAASSLCTARMSRLMLRRGRPSPSRRRMTWRSLCVPTASSRGPSRAPHWQPRRWRRTPRRSQRFTRRTTRRRCHWCLASSSTIRCLASWWIPAPPRRLAPHLLDPTRRHTQSTRHASALPGMRPTRPPDSDDAQPGVAGQVRRRTARRSRRGRSRRERRGRHRARGRAEEPPPRQGWAARRPWLPPSPTPCEGHFRGACMCTEQRLCSFLSLGASPFCKVARWLCSPCLLREVPPPFQLQSMRADPLPNP